MGNLIGEIFLEKGGFVSFLQKFSTLKILNMIHSKLSRKVIII